MTICFHMFRESLIDCLFFLIFTSQQTVQSLIIQNGAFTAVSQLFPHSLLSIIQSRRRGGLVVFIPATRSVRPGFESRPGAAPQCGLKGGISHCNAV